MIKIYVHERKLVLLSSLVLFSVVSSLILLKTIRDALFLARFPITMLPLIMVGTTFIVISAVTLHRRLFIPKFPVQTILRVLLAVFLSLTLGLWFFIRSRNPSSVVVLYLLTGVYATIIPMQAWIVVDQWLGSRQARRLIGIIGASAIGGAIAGGIFARWLTVRATPDTLVLSACGPMFIALIASFILEPIPSTGPTLRPQLNLKNVHLRHFIPLFTLFLFTGGVVSTLIDFTFKAIAQEQLASASQLASFFGLFHTGVGICTLLFQLFITPWLLDRVGLRRTLYFPPGAIFGLFLSLVFLPSLLMITLVKGIEQIFKNSLYRSTTELIYLIFPESTRAAIKARLDPIGQQLSEIGMSFFLLIAISWLHIQLGILNVLGLLLSGTWIFLAFMLYREYPKMLSGLFMSRTVWPLTQDLSLRRADLASAIPELMRQGQPRMIQDLLHFIEEMKIRNIGHQLVPLLDHQEPFVRIAALHALMIQKGDYSRDVFRLLDDPSAVVRMEAVHYLCMHAERLPHEALMRFLNDPTPHIRVAALGCALREKPHQLPDTIQDELMLILRESLEYAEPEIRIEIAHFLREIPDITPYLDIFKRLIDDPQATVRYAAYDAVRRHRPSPLIPALLHRYLYKTNERELRRVLIAYGERVISYLKAEDARTGLTRLQKHQCFSLASEIHHTDAVQWLVEQLHESAFRDGLTVLHFLTRIKRRNPELLAPFRPHFERLFDQECRDCENLLGRWIAIRPNREGLLHALFEGRLRIHFERLFRLLSLLYRQRFRSVFHSILQRHTYYFDTTLEWLDTMLEADHRQSLMQLMDRYEQLRLGSQSSPARRHEVLLQLIRDGDPIMAGAAIMEFTEQEWLKIEDNVRSLVEDASAPSFIREALQWRLSVSDIRGTKMPTLLEKMEMIRSIDLFRSLDPEDALLIAEIAEIVTYPAGHEIFHEGEIADAVYYLHSGRVVTIRNSGHREEIAAHQAFGVYAVLSGRPRLFSAQTVEPCIMLRIDRDQFWNMLEEYPSICRAILARMVDRIDQLTGQEYHASIDECRD